MKQEIWIEDWLAERAESEETKGSYKRNIHIFAEFSDKRWNTNFNGVVLNWRKAKRAGDAEREDFLEHWNDIVRNFNTYIKRKYAPLSVKKILTTVKSFLGFWNIPVNVRLPKRACVTYHNRDLTREELRQILTHASPRDRVAWLIMAESGMRASTLINLKYWQIKDDFEKGKIPMRIMLPSSSLKDRVGDRWTFIGEDGYKELKEYLKPRKPLRDDDYVIVSEKQGKVKGKQFTYSSLSVKFSRIVLKLDLAKPKGRKPKAIRMHSLRKYFRNNIKADTAYREFWMGHSLRTDEHYISRDVETHRNEYAKGYQHLRIYEPSEALSKHYVTVAELKEQLKMKDQDIKELKETVAKVKPLIEWINTFDTPGHLKMLLNIIKDDFIVASLDEKGRAARISSKMRRRDIPRAVSDMADELARRKGITWEEALEQLSKKTFKARKEREI